MLPQYKKQTNIGVTLGFLLQLLGVLAKWNSAPGLALLCLVPGLVLFLWGCIYYSKSKGYSGVWGLIGLGHLVGLMILIALPDRSGSLTDAGPSVDKTKKQIRPVYIGLTLVALLLAGFFLSPKLWHEYVYGVPLANLQELPRAVSQFLSLPALDPAKTRIEVSMSGSSQESADIPALTKYFNAKVGSRPGGAQLVSDLSRINDISDPLAKVDRLLKALIQYKELIRDESNQSAIIVYIHYYLKQPSSLDLDTRTAIALMIQKIDSPQKGQLFNSGSLPDKFLHGNFNIYPLAIENTAVYKEDGLPGNPTQPVLEIRFTGLGGIFQYLLESMRRVSGLSFVYLALTKLPGSATLVH